MGWEIGGSLVAQAGKNPSAGQEAQVQSLRWEAPLEKGMATHSSVLAWKTPWTEEPGGLSDVTERLSLFSGVVRKSQCD